MTTVNLTVNQASPTELALLMAPDEVDGEPAAPTTASSSSSNHKATTHSTLEAHDSLQTAKDRAQITASTSMSIVHVVLLKQLLVDYGPDTTTHLQYYVSLSLVIAALVVQVLAGFVAIYIAFIRKYVRRYKADAGDYRVTICPWRCKKKKPHHRAEIEQWINSDFSTHDEPESRRDSQSGGCCSGCCPWECQNEHFVYNGYNILDIHNYLQSELVEADALEAKYEAELAHAQTDVQSAKTALKNYTVSDAVSSDPSSAVDTTSSHEHIQRLEEALRQALARLNSAEKERRDVEVRQAKNGALQKHMDAIQSEIMLKQAESWQNVLNIMLYTVFILNAFIAGFGMSSVVKPPKDGGHEQ